MVFAPEVFSIFMEIVEHVGKTNLFHDFVWGESWKMLVLPTVLTISMVLETTAPAPEVFPNSWKLLEIGKTNIFHDLSGGESWKRLVLPTFPAISLITATMAPAPEVSPNSWEWLRRSDSPTLSTGKYFKTVLPKCVIEHILCTHAMCVCNMGRQSIRILDQTQ